MKKYIIKTKKGQVFQPQFKDLTEFVTLFHDIYCSELGLDKDEFLSIEEVTQQDTNRRLEVTSQKDIDNKEEFEDLCKERYGDNLPDLKNEEEQLELPLTHPNISGRNTYY
jgi:hypothetical protein